MNRLMLVPALIVATVLLIAAPALTDDDRGSIKERLEKRYPTLLKLENAGKAGEIYTGLAGAVKDAHLDERVDPEDAESPTLRAFLAEENKDRRRLFELVADGKDISAAEVGILSGTMAFKKAAPEHYLKPKGRVWIRKRDLKKSD